MAVMTTSGNNEKAALLATDGSVIDRDHDWGYQ